MEQNHAKEQAQAQYESILEMLEALDIEGAASQYAKDLTRERCEELLAEACIDCRPDEPLEDLREAVAVNIADGTIEQPGDMEWDEDDARERIQEDPLSVEVRSGWHTPGDAPQVEEFCILLCTGGPAVQIRGELDEHCEPCRAWLEYRDWGTPWTQYFDAAQDTLLQYAGQFYYG